MLIAPVLNGLGVDLLAGHLFLLYFAALSALTPPVAVAAYAASAIAEENPLAIAGAAVRIALAAFIVPFAFVYDPALIMKGSIVDVAYTVGATALGLIALAIALEGYFRRTVGTPARLILAGSGLFLLIPSPLADAAGVGLLATAILVHRFQMVGVERSAGQQ